MHPTRANDTDLDQVRDLQTALVQLLDSALDPSDKATAALRLLEYGRKSPVPEMALLALRWVVERHLDEITHPDDAFGSPAERRVLELHRQGEHVCTRCQLPLPAASTIRRWQRHRALAAGWRDWISTRKAEREAA